MHINWKVRVKSGAFWMGVLSAVTAAVFELLNLCGVVTGVKAEQVLQVGTLVLMALAAIGVITDPTTKGLNDSVQALTYDKPKEGK